MRRWFKTVHEGCKDFKCESCGKSLTQGYIKIINEGHKDFKCYFYGKLFIYAHQNCSRRWKRFHMCNVKSFTQVDSLKGHIRNIHKGHKSENTHQNHSQIS